MYVCMYVCMCVHVCMYVCMCMYGWMDYNTIVGPVRKILELGSCIVSYLQKVVLGCG